MKNKLWYLTKMSFNKKVKTKWFVIANIFILVMICALINIDSIIKFFGGDFNDVTDVLVIDNTGNVYDEFANYYDEYSTYFEDMNNVNLVLYDEGIEEAKKEVEENDSVLIEINSDENNFINASITTNKGMDAIVLQLVTSSLNAVKSDIALDYYEIDENMLAMIDAPVVIERINLDEDASTDEMMDLIMGVAFPIIILPFFMLTMFLVQMIGAEINEEKTTRGMEIIISNVPPKVHFFSKLIASNAFVLLQGFILIVDVILGVLLRLIVGGGSMANLAGDIDLTPYIESLAETGFIANLGYIIPVTLILMVITFIAYSLLAGILASMTTNMEDYQQLQTPIIIISLVGYYLAMMAAMFDGAIFIRILSYVPFLSALLSPALLILGQVGIIDVIISLVLLVGTVFILYKYGMKIYKVGILNYSSTGLWKKMFKAVKS